jgi:hypothetical protein
MGSRFVKMFSDLQAASRANDITGRGARSSAGGLLMNGSVQERMWKNWQGTRLLRSVAPRVAPSGADIGCKSAALAGRKMTAMKKIRRQHEGSVFGR